MSISRCLARISPALVLGLAAAACAPLDDELLQEDLEIAVEERLASQAEALLEARGVETQEPESASELRAQAVTTAEQPFIRTSNTYGYAGATFDWAASNRVTNIDLKVSDWECDGEPVYAYFMWHDGSRWDSTPTHRFDHSGCDEGDWSTYNNLTWSVSGASIVYMAVVICRDAVADHCKVGAVSGRNPRAPN